jgi:hypothetical protein
VIGSDPFWLPYSLTGSYIPNYLLRRNVLFHSPTNLLSISVQEICKYTIEYVGPICRSHNFNDGFKKKMGKGCVGE